MYLRYDARDMYDLPITELCQWPMLLVFSRFVVSDLLSRTVTSVEEMEMTTGVGWNRLSLELWILSDYLNEVGRAFAS